MALIGVCIFWFRLQLKVRVPYECPLFCWEQQFRLSTLDKKPEIYLFGTSLSSNKPKAQRGRRTGINRPRPIFQLFWSLLRHIQPHNSILEPYQGHVKGPYIPALDFHKTLASNMQKRALELRLLRSLRPLTTQTIILCRLLKALQRNYRQATKMMALVVEST